MSWFILFIAGIFETGWAIGLKYTEGFTKLTPTILTATSMIISVILLGIAMKNLPVGVAYLTWTAIGSIGTIILGVILFNDSMSIAKLICIMLIISGVVGLKIFSS